MGGPARARSRARPCERYAPLPPQRRNRAHRGAVDLPGPSAALSRRRSSEFASAARDSARWPIRVIDKGRGSVRGRSADDDVRRTHAAKLSPNGLLAAHEIGITIRPAALLKPLEGVLGSRRHYAAGGATADVSRARGSRVLLFFGKPAVRLNARGVRRRVVATAVTDKGRVENVTSSRT